MTERASADTGPVLIAVDWGTTSFRAFLLGRAGEILDRRSGPYGILQVEAGGFAAVLGRELAAWGEALPVLLSGMIGSRQGWAEAPYLRCPAAPADLAAGLLPLAVPGRRVFIVPGMDDHSGPMPDVMRGEEVQVLGSLLRQKVASATFVLPGTHSKWARVEGQRIAGFRTYMTGELFAACRGHTILGRLMPEGAASDPQAFSRGVQDGADAGSPGSLLNRLFGVRTAGLFGRIEPSGLADYLSGLLIGAEIASEAGGATGEVVWLLGAPALTDRYAAAGRELGLDMRPADPDSIVLGYLAIARAAGLIATATDPGEPDDA